MYDVTVEHNVAATMRDGTVVSTCTGPRRTAHQQVAHDAVRPSHLVLPVIPRESA